jgi:hypothetical protein
MSPTALAVVAILAAPQARGEDLGQLVLELRSLRSQVALLEVMLRKAEEAQDALARDVRTMGAELSRVAESSSGGGGAAAAFQAGPPASSDSAGVARTVVFAPRIEADASRRRDLITLKVKRIEAGEVHAIGSLEMTSDQLTAEIPIDRSGALYVVDWSTSEGHSYTLVLKDGATDLPAATVQVKPQQSEGRFVFVGYRLD